MKKSDIMLTFLFWTIIALVIFIPTVLWASRFFRFSDKSLDSYNQLMNTVGTIKDGEADSLPFYMDKKSVIVGFSKGSNRFENHQYYYGKPNPDRVVFFLNRPKECENLKACICLCCGITIEENLKSFAEVKPATTVCNKCGRGSTCKSFDNVDILSEKIVRRYGNGKPQNSWKGGFLHLRGVPVAVVVNGLGENEVATRVFYVQGYKGIVDVCLIRPCITDEIKKQIYSMETTKPAAPLEPLI